MSTPQLLVISTTENHSAITIKSLQKSKNWQQLSLPDADVTILNQDGEGIKIAEVRQLISDSSFKPYARAERAVLILNLEQASLPAQQALLKFFEEPPSYIRIIATTSQISSILPTIQSRCQISHIQQTTTETTPQEVQTWITKLPNATYADIIAISGTYKDKQAALDFLQNCATNIINSDSHPNSFTTFATQKILATITAIQANANTRLSIEDCFFDIKNRF